MPLSSPLMPRAVNAIPTCGEEGLFVTRYYLVSKLLGGRSEGIADISIDVSWKTFKVGNTEVVERWLAKWLGRTDKNKKVRDFYNRHKKERFLKYIATGEGKFCHRVIFYFFIILSPTLRTAFFHRLYPSLLGYRTRACSSWRWWYQRW